MNQYKIQGYMLASFEVVVSAATQDEAEELVEEMTAEELFKGKPPDGELTIESVDRVTTKVAP